VIYLHDMFYTALGRALAVALATLLMFGLVFLREATSPSGAGYWTAMAAAPGGDLYVADEAHRELRLIRSTGGWERLAAAPPGIFRALAADGPNMLLATEGELYQSNDTGAHWRGVLPGRFTAVALRGSFELAGAWGKRLFRSEDAGSAWSSAQVPEGDTEFEEITTGTPPYQPALAATLLGLLESSDLGKTWARVAGLPGRMTAVDGSNSEVAGWRGQVWGANPDGFGWRLLTLLPAGIWSITGSVVATTAGLYFLDGCPIAGPLHGREVTRLVLSKHTYYAAVARGPIYSSSDAVDWRLAYQR
jgi:photosystem II stability/assembly factor-like uncharacterized protein